MVIAKQENSISEIKRDYIKAFEFEKQAFILGTLNHLKNLLGLSLLEVLPILQILSEQIREAEKLISIGLAGDPPSEIAEEFRDLLQQVNFFRHLELHGIVLSPTELQLSLSGNQVGHGIIRSDEFLNRIEIIEELINELKKYNQGLANNVRGALFEFVVAHIHRENCLNIDLGREIIENSGRHDMDVLATYSSKVVVTECKATKSLVDLEMVENWITIKIPSFRSWILKQELFNKKNVEFEYWSTSGFTSEAIDKLSEVSSAVKLYKISYFGPEDLRQKAIEMKNKKLKEALELLILLAKSLCSKKC